MSYSERLTPLVSMIYEVPKIPSHWVTNEEQGHVINVGIPVLYFYARDKEFQARSHFHASRLVKKIRYL